MELCRGKQSRVGGQLLLSYYNQFTSFCLHAETSQHPWWGIRGNIYSHPSSRRFCYSSTSLQQSSWKPPPTCALWTWSQPKHLCPKPGSPEEMCMIWHPSTASLPALTEAVVIRRLLANTVPPKDCSCSRILMLPKGCWSKLLIVHKTQL